MSQSSSDETPLLSRGLDSPERAPAAAATTATTMRLLVRPKLANRGMSSSTPDPERPHVEKHMGQYDAVMRDVIIGFSDGLTVPFALTAGLSSLGDTKLVIMGGLAELFSGMISMGLGAFLAADTERQHWEAELAREKSEVETVPAMERAEIFDILAAYGISRAAAEPMVRELTADKEQWVRFMMDFELRLPEPDAGRAWVSAVTMGVSYFVGGLIPMLPYFFLETAAKALLVSVAITVVILVVFGFLKNWVAIRTRKAGFWGAAQTLFVGALAAGTSYAIVKLLDNGSS
ncbi:VIT family-domain-containing protein [Chaetomidium leptoderma]|uniref:VIT family-domain-containing protein n=1 Tax=Chaetomidium leptoderma TaxID=669021 RepID=A0AAN6VCS7_9PEZI|nr:VIT family-domain-containing protein [Chaetomidium leptoderma]